MIVQAPAQDGMGQVDAMPPSRLLAETLSVLAQIRIRPRRLVLRTPYVEATVPLLRGVWGAALHDSAPAAYRRVFVGSGPANSRAPCYILRPAAPPPAAGPDGAALDFLLWGAALADDNALCAAWHEAAERGLGSDRVPFALDAMPSLGPDGTVYAADNAAKPAVWTLDTAAWPLPGDPATAPVRLRFEAPLRVLRDGKRIAKPALPDLIVAACRRLAQAAGLAASRAKPWQSAAAELARTTPARPWRGQRYDLQRYSGTQQADIRLHGTAGWLDLPRGPGSLWPILAAAQWLHIGKGTVYGMGQLSVEALPVSGRRGRA